MKFEDKYLNINGLSVLLRSARQEDAKNLIAYLKTTSMETPYLIREPDEITITIEKEMDFIQAKEEAADELLLLAFCEGKHVGNCSFGPIGNFRRYAHRCEVAIALYQKYCGKGIGTAMLKAVLGAAKECGYEQAELEVISTNKDAIRLYEKFGFRTYGVFPDHMKYSDGSYADCNWMMLKL